ncbi:MAG: S1-C subfamily serine protease [Acidimicrobiales bacterium]|jgi:S1-C subfamily serine protease
MQFLIDIAVGVLTAYLTVTNMLADSIINILPSGSQIEISIEATDTSTDRAPSGFPRLASAYESIPQILIDNTAYQNASVIDTRLDVITSATPLDSLVNIFCTYATDEYIRSTTGTGYFIDRDGIVLTNAHVAQFLLLEGIEGSAECIIRTGNPAEPTYEADLLYISPAWVQKNANLITQDRPQGTGERDYALLYVTSGLDNKPMPRYFPALSFNTNLMSTSAIDAPVYAAGYPAQQLFSQGDASVKLIPKQATTTITELMTFGSNYADIFTIAGSYVGEQGSSGGPVVNEHGDAIGLISTRGDDEAFGVGSLRAITLSYIDRTITEETGYNLRRNLGGNLPFRSQLFKDTLVPFLRQMLERELAE